MILKLPDRAHPMPAQVSCLNVPANLGLCYFTSKLAQLPPPARNPIRDPDEVATLSLLEDSKKVGQTNNNSSDK